MRFVLGYVRRKSIELWGASILGLVLVSVYHLPIITKRALVLDYRAPTLLTAYASHFVHLTWQHLLANLVVFGLLFPLAYWLARAGRRRRVFHAATLTFLLAFPLALSALNLALPRPRIGFGFSGVAMAFLGLLPLVLAAAVEERYPRTEATRRAPGLFLVGLAVIAWLAVPPSGFRVLAAAAVTVAALAHLPRIPTATELGDGARWLTTTERGGLVLAGLVALLLIPLAAFPPSPASDNAVLNIYSHFLGYCLGFIVPYTAVQVGERLEVLGRTTHQVRRPGGDRTPGSRFHREVRVDGD